MAETAKIEIEVSNVMSTIIVYRLSHCCHQHLNHFLQVIDLILENRKSK